MSNYTPRSLRRGHGNKSGTKDKEKQRAFRRAKRLSDRFIHQSASWLDKNAAQYAAYCGIVDRDALRK